MRRVDAYNDLLELGRPVVETREAAARLRISGNTTVKTLRALETAGLVRQVRRGLWALDPETSPTALAPYLTAPYPAYISFWSALARHDMIEQIPASIEVASLDRTQRIETAFGTFQVHRLAPEVFTGYEGDPDRGYIATPEKAFFDLAYVRAPRGAMPRLPELTLPDGFRPELFEAWLERIPRPRLRTLVARGIESALRQADAYADEQ